MTTVNSSFQSMLNEYLPNTMLMEEMIKRDWYLSNLEIDNSWKGSNIIVPFKGAGASSVAFGELTSSSDVAESVYVRGSITSYKEVWGTMMFNHRDLMDADGQVTENTFLKILPKEVDMFIDNFKQVVSTSLGCGSHFAKFTANGTAGGVIVVDHIDRFQLGQKLEVDDDNSAALVVYVIAISIDDSSITVSATRGGAAVDVSMYTTAQNAKCYHPGVLTNGSFNSIRASLLSAANGGSATIHGQTKTAFPILQAVNILGSSWTATNLLDKLFDAFTTMRQKAKGKADTVVMSFKHLGNIMKLLESQKGSYLVTKSASASLYGWTEIGITNVTGQGLSIVGIVEQDDDVIFFLDKSSMVFRTRGGFKKRMGPNGNEYFEVRNTTGFVYLIDNCLFGELEVNKPGHNGIVHSISY